MHAFRFRAGLCCIVGALCLGRAVSAEAALLDEDELAEVVRKPSYSTAVGLLLLGKEQMVRQAPVKVESGGIGSIFERMKSWFGSNF